MRHQAHRAALGARTGILPGCVPDALPGRPRAITRLLPCVLLLAATLAGAAPAADVYRWRDADGKVVFGDRPPADSAERLHVPSKAPAADHARRDFERARALSDGFAAEREARAEARAAARREAAERERACVAARAEQRRREHANHLYYQSPDGTKRVVEGAEYEAAIGAARAAVARACG